MTNLARIIQMARDGEAISSKSMRDAIVALADEVERLKLLQIEQGERAEGYDTIKA